MATIEDNNLNQMSEEEARTIEELEKQKQEKRKKNIDRARKLARAGQAAAYMTGHPELAEALGETARGAKETGKDEDGSGGIGFGRKAGSNYAGRKLGELGVGAANKWGKNRIANAGAGSAGKLGNAAANMGGGSSAALGGAVAGALQGEGAGGIVRSAASWYVLWFAFGFLTLNVLLSPTIVTIIPAFIALTYLDFHFIMSQFGFKWFGQMNLLQKGILLFANLIVAIIPLMFVAIYSVATCQIGKDVATVAGAGLPFGLGTAVTAYVHDYCDSPDSIALPTTIPRSTEGNLEIIITSAYRPGSNGSAHQRGEAIDIALRPIPTSDSDPRIQQLFNIAKAAGLVPPVGDTIDEWNNPQENTSAGHIHLEFNLKQRGNLSSGSYCSGVAVTIPPTDLVNLSDYGLPFTGIVAPNQPKVRPCMIPIIQRIFDDAGYGY